MNILLIDDDNIMNFLIDLLIKDEPCIQEYHIMDKAEDALKFLKTYKKLLSCIFADIKMSGIDRFEFVRK